MGLSNSPATFQRLMDMVLRGLTWESVLVYIDDIVVYAHTYEELKTRLEEVFIQLRGANLKLKPTKVKLFQCQIQFLGHLVSGQGVAMDQAKISEIVSWHRPKNVHDVRQFLGLCGYYGRFVMDYAQVAAPLHELTRVAEPFLWTEARDAGLRNSQTASRHGTHTGHVPPALVAPPIRTATPPHVAPPTYVAPPTHEPATQRHAISAGGQPATSRPALPARTYSPCDRCLHCPCRRPKNYSDAQNEYPPLRYSRPTSRRRASPTRPTPRTPSPFTGTPPAMA